LKLKTIKQNDCTVGVLTFGTFRCLTLELPDLDNQQDISCIPHGLYQCEKYHSNTHGWCVAIHDVLDRTFIRIHAGNFTRQILGCILVGSSITDIDGDGILDVSNSGNTMKKLMAILPDKFELEITRI